ncbi:MAG: DUF1800 domain-containing protein [Chitinophagaceae bacterium]|jgi:uncharacterized protein (DUF1800 family)|nr:DUF1800 domain-containing protein [Chitinophagaceae bacterium]
MPASVQLKNQHLLWRAGFGPAVEQWNDLAKVSPSRLYEALEKASRKEPMPLKIVSNFVEGLMNGVDGVRRTEITKEQRQEMQKKSREEIRNLNLEWLDEMVNSDQQLREKLAFFWHGHFACRNLNALYQQDLINVIRKNALGNFGTMLKEVSRSAAMLAFLNNQQNRKQKPNENFAREVMELFTMGRGNYTEKDIKEAARAFTGWQFQLNGEFVFRKNLHDNGVKTVLGQTGSFDGDDVLNILLEQKQTAAYITTKLYRFFVNEEVDEKKIKWLADRFYKSGYEIAALLKDMFTSDWFYDEKNIGSRVKSPVELLVGIRRSMPMQIENEDAQLYLQKILGQILFYPPNVAGWPAGLNWIDSSSLMFRMRIPQLIAYKEAFTIRAKSDDDQEMGRMQPALGKLGGRVVKTTIRWEPAMQQLEKVGRENLLSTIATILWQTNASAINKSMLEKFADASSRERYVQTSIIQLMCTPEYQMC